MIDERHTSPDGEFTLVVERVEGTDDFAIGFEGFEWHTHADLLGSFYRQPESVAVRTFVDAVLSDQLYVVVDRHDGLVSDVSVTFDPASEGDDLPPGFAVELRTWSGSKYGGLRNPSVRGSK